MKVNQSVSLSSCTFLSCLHCSWCSSLSESSLSLLSLVPRMLNLNSTSSRYPRKFRLPVKNIQKARTLPVPSMEPLALTWNYVWTSSGFWLLFSGWATKVPKAICGYWIISLSHLLSHIIARITQSGALSNLYPLTSVFWNLLSCHLVRF